MGRLKRAVKKDKNYSDLGKPWFVVLSALAVFLISQFIAALVAAIALNIIHPHTSLNVFLNQSAPFQFVYVLLAEGLAGGLCIYIVKKVRRLKLGFIGLGRKPGWSDLGKGALGILAFYGLLIIASIIISFIWPDIKNEAPQEVGFNTLNSSLDKILAFSALVFLPPIGEEILMRGYIYSGLRAYIKFWPALLITSLLFGLAHLDSGSGGSTLWAAAIDTFLLSGVLVFLREKTGALYAGMLLHAFNNIIAFFAHFHS